jgi:MFS transporter, DHA1 family, multidrug resistance protein
VTARVETGRLVQINFALLASLTMITSLTPYTTDSFLPGFPSAAREFGTSASTMQLTLTTFLIGVAAGQLFFGPLSDRVGRRGPLLIGTAVCAAAAVAAALAPSAAVLILARLVQGLAASAGMAIAKAIIRDRTAGADTTSVLSVTTVASGALNLLAPFVGGQLTAAFGWRGPLWFIAADAVLLLVVIAIAVPETHPEHLRDSGPNRYLGLPGVIGHLRNRSFLVYVIIQAGSYGTLMAYVASSPFVYQNVLGFSSAEYGTLFTVNAACAVTVNFVTNRWLKRFGSKKLVMWGLGLSMLGTLLTATAWGLHAPAGIIAAAITCSMAPLGLNGPNLIGMALNQVTRGTGSASATIGFVQFCTGSIVSPVVGLFGAHTLLPQIVAMIVLAGSALTFLLLSHRSERSIRVAEKLAGDVPAAG